MYIMSQLDACCLLLDACYFFSDVSDQLALIASSSRSQIQSVSVLHWLIAVFGSGISSRIPIFRLPALILLAFAGASPVKFYSFVSAIKLQMRLKLNTIRFDLNLNSPNRRSTNKVGMCHNSYNYHFHHLLMMATPKYLFGFHIYLN